MYHIYAIVPIRPLVAPTLSTRLADILQLLKGQAWVVEGRVHFRSAADTPNSGRPAQGMRPFTDGLMQHSMFQLLLDAAGLHPRQQARALHPSSMSGSCCSSRGIHGQWLGLTACYHHSCRATSITYLKVWRDAGGSRRTAAPVQGAGMPQTLASHQPRQRLCPLGPPAKEDFAFASGKRGKREMQALDLLDTEQLPLSQMEQIKTLSQTCGYF